MLDKDKLETLRNQYYQGLCDLQNEEDFVSYLPSPNYPSFFSLMSGLLQQFMEDRDSLLELHTDDIEVLNEIELLNRKITLCEDKIKEVEMKNNVLNIEDSKEVKRHLIFATTVSGIPFIQRDLKNIPEEYYDRFIDSLNQLEFGELNTNIEKSKQLIALGDVYEIKRFGFRLVYRFLSSDTVYVMLAFLKKKDNGNGYRNNIRVRDKNTIEQCRSFEDAMKNSMKKELLIMEHEEMEKELISFLEEKRRGHKDGKSL